MKSLVILPLLLLIVLPPADAQDDNSLTRNEVAAIKKKLVAVVEALGAPPAGYAKSDESFYLPTEAYKDASGGFRPIGSNVNLEFGSASEKKAKKSGEDLEKEYEKKLAEAQAKGDYQEVMKLAQEMQQKMGQAQLEVAKGKKEPIQIRVQLNSNPYQTIDPDEVLFESAGVIALKFKQNLDDANERVTVYFDPVHLKDTGKLSRVDLKEPKDGVEWKTTILNATVEFSGPATEVESWAKKVSVKKVLAQIDAGK